MIIIIQENTKKNIHAFPKFELCVPESAFARELSMLKIYSWLKPQ